MELKLIQVHRAHPAFQKIVTTDLPAKIAFRLSRVAKAIDDVFSDIEKQRINLVKKYGEQSSQGITVKQENIAKFQEEFGTLLAEESIEVDVKPIKLELLEDIKLTALEIIALEPFIEE